MKTSLEHLPSGKKQEILAITETIKEVIKPEKIVLFGSYATGKWIEDKYIEDDIVYEYRSDYDFLVIVDKDVEEEYILANKVTNHFRHFHTPVNPIIHDISYVNKGLLYGQYFFADIVKEGVLLFDTDNVVFAEPKVLTPEEKRRIAQESYDQWFTSASRFLRFAELGYEDTIKENAKFNETAFLMHQATEHFYGCMLLVFTGYKPKTHNLERLHILAKPLSDPLLHLFLFPGGEQEKKLFALLNRAYVDARYKRDYVISQGQTENLLNRIRRMQEIVQGACLERIASL